MSGVGVGVVKSDAVDAPLRESGLLDAACDGDGEADGNALSELDADSVASAVDDAVRDWPVDAEAVADTDADADDCTETLPLVDSDAVPDADSHALDPLEKDRPPVGVESGLADAMDAVAVLVRVTSALGLVDFVAVASIDFDVDGVVVCVANSEAETDALAVPLWLPDARPEEDVDGDEEVDGNALSELDADSVASAVDDAVRDWQHRETQLQMSKPNVYLDRF